MNLSRMGGLCMSDIVEYVEFLKKRKRELENLIDIYQEGFFTYTKSELEEKLKQCNRLLKSWGE